MTKKLSDLFELPAIDDTIDIQTKLNESEIIDNANTNLEKIELALSQVRGLDNCEEELDELAQLATNSFKDLSELGMQVDSRFASEIFNSASSMLGHAITAKTAKLNKKLKMIDLQLKKAALDQKVLSKTEEIENTPLGTGQSLDRNELLRMLAGKTKEE